MTNSELFIALLKQFPEMSRAAGTKDNLFVRIPQDRLLDFCQHLKSAQDLAFDYLLFMTAVDWKGPVSLSGYVQAPTAGGPSALVQGIVIPPREVPFRETFELIYMVRSLTHKMTLGISVEILRPNAQVPSVVSVWSAADWQEREVYDLFGITFVGHPNLRRLLTPESQQGHPLRKDYVHTLDKYDGQNDD
jgi:NADH-quinone oxidoreductase subunit C